MADNHTMEEMLQAPTEGYGDAIVVPNILAERFEISIGLLSLIQANQFHGFESNNLHDHIRSFNRITPKLMLFPYSLEGAAKIWYKKEPPRSILTCGDLLSKFINHFFPPSKTTHLKNEITRFTQKFEETFREAWERFKEMLKHCPHHGFLELHQINTFYNGLNKHEQDSLNVAPVAFKVSTTSSGNSSSTNARIDKLTDTISNLVETFNKKMTTPAMVKAVEETCVIYGGAHPYYDCIATDSNISSVCATTGTNTVPNPQEDLKAITTRSDVTLAGPSVSPLPSKEVDREPETITDQMLEVTKDTVQPSTENIQPSVAQTQVLIGEPVVASKPKPTIPYPSRANKQKLRKKDDMLALKFLEIFRNLHFELSFTDALLHMPKFALMFKSLLNNKEKLFDLATTSVNENCSTVILKKLPEKLGDPGKFLIPCDFPEFDEFLALADLDSSINLMPLSIWRKLSLPELTSTQMILELADRSTTRPACIAEDVFVKVGKTERALIDVYGEELTLRVDDEAVTFNVGQTSKYSYKDAESINQIDVIDVACEEYVQEVLGFSDNSKSSSPTPTLDPIISSSSTMFTPFEGSDFILEEIETFLQTPDELSNLDDDYYDTEGDILPWVSPVHYVPKKGGKTVVKNEDNELIPTRRMPFGLCNAPGTFQRCMMAIFHDMIEKMMEVFMDDFLVFSDSFSSCLSHLDKMLQRYEDTNLVLNWEKCHFMVNEGIVLGHKISKSGIEVDRAKVDVIAKLSHPNSLK
nr:reverse transcriptase domain-containing protein [Tanacetum cinerariifolium]